MFAREIHVHYGVILNCKIFKNHFYKMSKGVNELLTDIASRCNIRNEKVLRKSKELISRLNSKQLLNCSDTCKAVVCLELASSLSLCPLNREEAIKYSGCKKRNYLNAFNNIAKLLNVDKVYSVREICVLLGVSDIQESAMQLFEKYKNIYKECDFEHPMYVCAAVLATCRRCKIKVNVTKLVEISRIKKMELDELVKKFQDLINTEKKSGKTGKKLSNFFECPLPSGEEETEETSSKKRTSGVMTDEEYNEWKRKMLEE